MTINIDPIFVSNSYELNIISQDEISKGKVLKQYDVDGEKVIGCYENEPFMIQFKNKTWNKISVRISLDGTDIISGSLANTSTDGDMWVVNGYGTLELKAFPETNKGGASFVFGKTEDSVAINTHGIKTGIGYIAVAIFTEEVQQNYTWNSGYHQQINIQPISIDWRYNGGYYGGVTYGADSSITINSSTDMGVYSANAANISSSDCCEISEPKTGPAIGAGEYINQEITKVAGLNKLILSTTICVKYEWWTSLRSKIRKMGNKSINPAFPGDQVETQMIDLKSTPRKNKKTNIAVKYSELNRFG